MKRKIVLADDHAIVRNGVKAVLEKLGKNMEIVAEISNGKDLVDYAQKHALPNPHFFCDWGYSGTTADRPEYCRMLQAVTSGHVANLVVAKLDRLIRGNVLDCGRVVKMMLDNNVTLYSIEKDAEAAHQAISLANAIEVAYQERGRM